MTDRQSAVDDPVIRDKGDLDAASAAKPRRGVVERMRDLPAPVVYGLAIFLTKAFAFITVPLASFYIAPADYGQFAIAVAFVEIVGIVASFGMGKQLIRFASTEATSEGSERVARELLGSALVGFCILTFVTQTSAPFFLQSLGIDVAEISFRALLLSSCGAALLELPMIWFRLRDRPWAFLFVMLGRTVVSVIAMWAVLDAGYGVDGLMISNALCMIASAVIVAAIQWRETGAAIARARFRQVAVYGAPIVGAGLAMYLFSNGSRLFMAEQVDDAIIGFFDMAVRFAVIVVFLFAPFDLWWQPKRIALLQEEGGYARSAEYWALGVSILLLSGGAVALTGPIFIELAMPEAYAPVSDYLPFTIGMGVLAFLVLLTNVGAYARNTSFLVLALDSIGAAVAIGGYFLLIPSFGVWGVVVAVVAANVTRLGLYIAVGRSTAPIPYPWWRAALAAGAAALIVWAAPSQETWLLRFAYSCVAGIVLFGLLLALGLMRPLEKPLLKLARTVVHVR